MVEFYADQKMAVSNIDMYATKGGDQYLPWSYGVDFSKLNQLQDNYKYNQNTGRYNIYLGNNGSNNAYVIKVEGKLDPSVLKTGTEFTTHSIYQRSYYEQYYDNWGYLNNGYISYSDNWSTWIKFYKPDIGDSDELVYNILNIKNKIKFYKIEKVDEVIPQTIKPSSNGYSSLDQVSGVDNINVNPMSADRPNKYLKDAVFQLKVKDGDTWNDYGDTVTSDELGEFGWEGLPEGEYQVWETKAPEGYVLPDKAVSSFKVDDTGNIVEILNNTQIIPNERDKMKFYIDKIWKDEEDKEHRIEFGTLEFELKAPEGTTFPDNVNADAENAEVSDRKYKITKVSDDKTTITLSMDLKTAYEGISSEEDVNKAIKINVPSDWPSGVYTLKETKAPAGFKIGTETYTINIDQTDRTIKSGETVLYSKSGESETINPLKIVNERGIFPSTGGFGSLIFTILGLGLMATAFIGYRQKKVIR